MNEELLSEMLVGRRIVAVKCDGQDGLNVTLDNDTELIVYTDGLKLVAEVAS